MKSGSDPLELKVVSVSADLLSCSEPGPERSTTSLSDADAAHSIHRAEHHHITTSPPPHGPDM
ncbi:hypothetical protein EYF80_050440 [Liparis tanakae]|uniref:Uncharacterized protein n=1 Tax=Liparis tanakae TaxID=230148 RepID=A0A4Z2FE51_9TELE|nr:hypothetical protein EYF80_050440 [Liparis tanakae]